MIKNKWMYWLFGCIITDSIIKRPSTDVPKNTEPYSIVHDRISSRYIPMVGDKFVKDIQDGNSGIYSLTCLFQNALCFRTIDEAYKILDKIYSFSEIPRFTIFPYNPAISSAQTDLDKIEAEKERLNMISLVISQKIAENAAKIKNEQK